MTNRFIPPQSLEGGTPIGSSYLRAYVACPYSFFNQYLRPENVEENNHELVGIQSTYTAPALLAGTMFHAFMEELYHSGCKDGIDTGQWNIDQAIVALEKSRDEVEPKYEKPSKFIEDYDDIHTVCRTYVDHYGPYSNSPYQEYPNYTVAFDGDGEPLIERQFSLDLGYKDYYATIKPDVIMYRDGYLITRDHKSAAKGSGKQRLNNINIDCQFTMEYMILGALFPDEPFDGSEVNIAQKGYIASSKVPIEDRFLRGTTTRSPDDIASFKADTIDLLEKIDQAVANFRDLWKSTGDLELAAGLAFPRHGMRIDNCHSFGRPCDFIDLCIFKDNIGNNLGAFRTRKVAQEKDSVE